MINRIKKFKYEILVSIFAITYFVYFTVASFLKYSNFYMGKFDLGNMTQTVWNTIHGNIFMFTNPNGTEEISRLAFHADFILIFLSPFYLIWEDPRMLLLIQTFILSLGGIFIYLIAKHVIKNKLLATTLALCFYLNPAVAYTNLYDFHAVTLATTFLLAAFYFILKKKWGFVIMFLFIAGITKEQVWAITALLGLYVVFISKKRLIGTSITVFSLFAFIYLFWVAIPANIGGEHFAVEFYSDYGISTSEIIKNVFLNPIQTIQILLEPDRLNYIRQLFIPLGYLSFIAFPFLIFALPDLAINLLSGSPTMHQIYYQYSATITPFIFISAIYAISWILKKLPEIPYQAICLILVIFTLISSYNYGPLLFAKKPSDSMFTQPLKNKEYVTSYLKTLTNENIISASNNLGSQLSHRKQIFVAPNGYDRANTILFLMRRPNNAEIENFNKIKNNPEFYLELQNEDFYVFKRH